MNTNGRNEIPGRLVGAGFVVRYCRISCDPDRPLWSAKASRGGREWSTIGEDLCMAFLELERQNVAADADWRAIIRHEVQVAHAAKGAG